MNAKEFVKTYQPKFEEYCPCVIDWKGEVYECESSHLNTLIWLSGEKDILNKLPENISPLFYLTEKLGCVLVDYENQIYSRTFSEEQQSALAELEKAKLILMNPINIHGKMTI